MATLAPLALSACDASEHDVLEPDPEGSEASAGTGTDGGGTGNNDPGSSDPGSSDPGSSDPGSAEPGGGSGVEAPETQCALDLASQFEMVEFEVPVNAQQDRSVPLVVTSDHEGGLWLAWTDSPHSEGLLHGHIRHLNSDLEMEGVSIDLPDSVVVGMYAHGDGTLAVAHGRRTGPESNDPDWNGSPGAPAPNTLFLSKYDGTDEVFRTQVRGGEGYTNMPESTWFLGDWTAPAVSVAYDGSSYGLFYAIGRFFEDGGVHQGDEYVQLSSDGEIQETTRRTWISSHSFWPSALAKDGTIYTATSADPFPDWGVRIDSYRGGEATDHAIVWPSADIADQVPVSGPAAKQGALFGADDKLGLVLLSWIDPASPSVKGSEYRTGLLMFETDGALHSYTPLSATGNVENDLMVGGARFGNDVLTLVAAGGNAGVFGYDPLTAQVHSVDGEALTDPVQLDARISWGSDPVTLLDGSVVWPAVKDNVSRTVQLARVSCN